MTVVVSKYNNKGNLIMSTFQSSTIAADIFMMNLMNLI